MRRFWKWSRHRLVGGALMVVTLILAACGGPSVTGTTNIPPDQPLTQYVNPLVGSTSQPGGDNGNTFPGADYPLGMLQWSPDTNSIPPGGYNYYDQHITGFGLTHFSGRGCTVYQDFPLMPVIGPLGASPAVNPDAYTSTYAHASQVAHPGYYAVHLDRPNVTAQLTVSPRTGIGEFTYPATTTATMLLNVSGSVNGARSSQVTIDAAHQTVTGNVTSKVGCGSQYYTVYFVAQFDHAFTDFGVWQDAAISDQATDGSGSHDGAFVTFDTTSQPTVEARVAISFVSVANARDNLARENLNHSFADLRGAADAAWNARLNAIQVTGGTPDERGAFYTALYHAFIDPSVFNDANGQYLGFDQRVHTVAPGHAQYANISSWDFYRTLIPLRAMLDPAEASDIAQSLVNDAQQGKGYLPRWEQANTDSRGMNGDDADVEIAMIYALGGTAFDTRGALQAMVQGQQTLREGLNDYVNLGYIPATSDGFSVDVTMEYAIDDFAIAQFAQSLGQTAISKQMLGRTGNWVNVLNPASGYVQPRLADGTWAPGFSPTGKQGFEETDSAQTTWKVPFDLRDLVGRLGGNAPVVNRLDTFFTKLNGGLLSPYADMGNEPSFDIPWVYDFAGAPSHTQSVTRRIEHLFTNDKGGLPGNDDGGAMSAWYIYAALGLYPAIPGAGGFAVGSPLFTSATIRLGGGKLLQINAPAAADATPYVQTLRVNGAATSALWLPWSALRDGATLDFALVATPTTWGTAPGDAPPSYPPGT